MPIGDAAGVHQVADEDEDRHRDKREGIERVKDALADRRERYSLPPDIGERGNQDREDHRKADRRTERRKRQNQRCQVPSARRLSEDAEARRRPAASRGARRR